MIVVTLKRHRKAAIAFVVAVANCIHSEVFRHQVNASSYISLQIRPQKYRPENSIQEFGLALLFKQNISKHVDAFPQIDASSCYIPEG